MPAAHARPASGAAASPSLRCSPAIQTSPALRGRLVRPRAPARTSGPVAAAAPATSPPPSALSGDGPFAIEAAAAAVTYGSKRALRGASLTVPRGTLHILLGPNGCGKSTLLRAVGGLATLTSGAARCDPPAAFVFQNPDHQVVMPTVGADVAFGLGRLGRNAPAAAVSARVEAALATVGLAGSAARPVHTLSGGQKQRVAIAGALAQAPSVLLLDELTTFLDGDDAAGVMAAVRAAIRAGAAPGAQPVTALWVTHRLDELRHADGASLMEGGKVVVSGSPAEVAAALRARGAPAPRL